MSPKGVSVPTNRITRILPSILFLGVYGWSLSYGYLWDDFVELQADLDYVLERLQHHFRPIYYFSELFFNALFNAPYQHRLVNLLLLAGAAFFAVRAAAVFEVPAAPLVVTAIFFHPTFVYPATWISQRNDGYLLLFLFMALANVNRPRGFVYLLLSDISKTPWVLQNLWYAWRQWRQGGNLWVAAAAVVAIPLIVGQGIFFWSEVRASGNSPVTQFTGQGLDAMLFVVTVWFAKLTESILLVHVPISAFYGVLPTVGLGVIALIYLAAWGTIAVQAFRTGWKTTISWQLLFLALLMSLPFVANSDPRVFGPAIPFFYLFWAMIAADGKAARFSFIVILAANLTATMLNYRLSDTQAYDPALAPDYTLCGKHEVQFPMERWRCDRSKLTYDLVGRINEMF